MMTAAERRESFLIKPVGRRAAIVAAGPIANFILAIVIFAAIFIFYGKPSTTARVDTVQPDSAAAAAGFQPGDVVVAIDGTADRRPSPTCSAWSASAPASSSHITVDRGGAQVDAEGDAGPARDQGQFRQRAPDRRARHQRAQTAADDPASRRSRRFDALIGWASRRPGSSSSGRCPISAGSIVGRESADQLGGPIRIAQVSGQVATVGFVALIHLAAVLSVSIGLLNLFPIPLLDGGHLLFYAIEAIRGRPLSERAQEMGFRIGLALVVMLMIFATFNDIIHLCDLVTPPRGAIRVWRGGNLLRVKANLRGGFVCSVAPKAVKASGVSDLLTIRTVEGVGQNRRVRMGMCARLVRGLGLAALLLGGIAFGVHRGRGARRRLRLCAIRKRDRRRGQPPGRGGHHPLLFPARPRRPARCASRSTRA